jgi:hypothetical protein
MRVGLARSGELAMPDPEKKGALMSSPRLL